MSLQVLLRLMKQKRNLALMNPKNAIHPFYCLKVLRIARAVRCLNIVNQSLLLKRFDIGAIASEKHCPSTPVNRQSYNDEDDDLGEDSLQGLFNSLLISVFYTVFIDK